MKKFITTVPLQPKGLLKKNIYIAADNSDLQYNQEMSFPILALINAYAENEEIVVVSIKSECENADNNYNEFLNQLDILCSKKNIKYKEKIISVPYNNELDTHLDAFQQLIDIIENKDELYTCMTFGTKPIPIIQNMALNYAYKIHKDIVIGCIAYGQFEHESNKAKIYDITSFFYMNEIVNSLAEQKVLNPKDKIKRFLEL